MTLIQSIILGIIQGLTEFIPVSSSAHLSLIPKLFGWAEHSTAFDIVLHAGTLLALLIYFRKKIVFYASSLIGHDRKNKTTTVRILFASIPAIFIAGIITVLNNIDANSVDKFIKNINIEIFFLIFIGILLIASDFAFKNNDKKIEDLSVSTSQLIGFSQAIALIRGVSRSGITILAGLTAGLKREEAAEFSFLIGIPVISFGFIYQIYDFMKSGFDGLEPINLVVGFLVSFISGYIAISFLLGFLKNNGLKVFGVYRIILAIVVILLLKLNF